MTKKEAINDLKDFIDTYITVHGEEDIIAVSLDNVDVEALGMAIKALQEPILDKIRAEIETWHKEGTNWSDIRLMNIENIIDKYQKGEE